MNNAQIIINEITCLKKKIQTLEQELKNIQQKCDHDFNGDSYSRICSKCSIVEVLYY
ncbi:serine protease [Bacillus salitolerans]|uniref:Serine protease n=1 Tax=Bacillus salitolerans TaxID=1437434 RepID=A0ABW4LSB3_9BACI